MCAAETAADMHCQEIVRSSAGFFYEGSFKIDPRHGFTIEISLKCQASVLPEKIPLFYGLNSFGDDVEFEILGHANDRLHQNSVIRIARDVADKRLVDLDLGKRQPLQN